MKYLFIISITFFGFILNAKAQKEYSGSGDDVITIEKPKDGMPALIQIQGNASERHFSITGYDESGNKTGLLVNTTKSYRGSVPLDLGTQSNTNRLEISANGSWRLKIYQIGAATKINTPGRKSGTGDDVLWIKGKPSTLSLTGNSVNRHFSATCYDKYGSRLKLLVNTTSSYDGKVIMPSSAQLIVISAVGSWEASLE